MGGLPLMEAMATGLPTIATNWSGQTEFMHRENSWLLDYELVPHPTARGHFWAEANASQLRQALRAIVRQPREARRRAEIACQEVHERYALESVGRMQTELISTHILDLLSSQK